MTDGEFRRSMMLQQESLILARAGQCCDRCAVAGAKGVIDGAVNAMIRLHGAKAAAEFMFALSDRVVSGVRCDTVDIATAAKGRDAE